jgi:DNA-binding FadR family transcriptional regulator
MGGYPGQGHRCQPYRKDGGEWAGRLISYRQYNGIAVTSDLRHQIAHVKASGRLPGELEMPGQYGAAPVTIRRAVAILAARGVVLVTCGPRAFAAAGE